MRHIISVILENEAGALSRVSGLFTQRGFNIESLTVAITNDPSLSRMTIVSSGSDRVLEQIVKQLNKLIEVVKVSDLTSRDHVERELMLVKISSNLKDGVDLKELTEIFGCKVVDVTDKIYTIEVSGKTKKINAFLDAFDSANIIEVSRTGVTGISRGKKLI
jgi:acetolactate synthase-1/3 small subunit